MSSFPSTVMNWVLSERFSVATEVEIIVFSSWNNPFSAFRDCCLPYLILCASVHFNKDCRGVGKPTKGYWLESTVTSKWTCLAYGPSVYERVAEVGDRDVIELLNERMCSLSSEYAIFVRRKQGILKIWNCNLWSWNIYDLVSIERKWNGGRFLLVLKCDRKWATSSLFLR